MGVADEIGGLLATTAGGELLSRDEIDTYLASDLAAVFVAVAGDESPPEIRQAGPESFSDEVIVGVTVAREFTAPEALSEHPYLHSNPAELLPRIDLTEAEFPVGSVVVTCIAEAYQGKGLGRKITHSAIEFLVTNETTPVVQLEWDRPDSPGVEKMKETGYTPRTRLGEHFPPGWTCTACDTGPGGGRCTCDVVVFVL